MKRTKALFSALILMAFGLCSAVFADPYLEPEDSIFSSGFSISRGWPRGVENYYSIVIKLLSTTYARDVKFRVIALPSFQREYAVALRSTADGYEIFGQEPEKQIWSVGYNWFDEGRTFELKEDKDGKVVRIPISPPNPKRPAFESLKINECRIEIAKELAETLIELWKSMLLETRYHEKNTLGFDGETYHFSMNVGPQTLAGKTWSPDPNLPAGQLVSVVHLMKAQCEKPEEAQLRILTQQSEKLLRRLKRNY